MFYFYTKCTFSEGIEMEHWAKMGESKFLMIDRYLPSLLGPI